MTRIVLAARVALAFVLAACSTPNLLGGREKCWSDSDPHLAALLDGRLDLSVSSGGGTLHTSDGTDFETVFPFMTVRSNGGDVVLVDRGTIVAASGETVTVFGGLADSGIFAVCSIEERHVV